MDTKNLMIIIAALCLLALIVVLVIIRNTKKSASLKQAEDINFRFNAVKTVPIAFKLNKALIMAKRDEKASKSVKEYYDKYEEAEKHINDIQDMINNLDDMISSKKYAKAKKYGEAIINDLSRAETEIENIDTFLDKFSEKENTQREYSSKLKEEYRIIKNAVNSNANALSISFSTIEQRIAKCEDLFSQSEEWLYANDYSAAQDNLEKIEIILTDLRKCGEVIPGLIVDVKGVIPTMIDEIKRNYALTKQRGVYLNHLDVENKLKKIESNLQFDTKLLIDGKYTGIKEHNESAKDVLNTLTEQVEAENRSFKEAKETNERVLENIADLDKIENYVRIAYDKDSARYGLENLKDVLKKQRDITDKYRDSYKAINEKLAASNKPSSELLDEAIELLKQTEDDKKDLYSYKTVIDKSNDGETRAISQLTKLQLVVSEVEMKIAEYHLPSISPTYEDDLAKSRSYILSIKQQLKAIPISIEELNNLLDEAIDFIFKFYNNVNNIVGMAIMVENAIVFGNKYRSTYPEIDRELSKAEFQYLNGEYTKALRTAISCMETLFPENADQKIMENA